MYDFFGSRLSELSDREERAPQPYQVRCDLYKFFRNEGLNSPGTLLS